MRRTGARCQAGLVLSLAVLLVGCGGGRSVITLDVTSASPLDGIDHLRITARNQGQVAGPVAVQFSMRPFSLPPSRSVALGLDSDRQGRVDLTVEAVAVNKTTEQVLAAADVFTEISSGASPSVMVVLGSTMDGGVADAAKVEDALVDQSLATDAVQLDRGSFDIAGAGDASMVVDASMPLDSATVMDATVPSDLAMAPLDLAAKPVVPSHVTTGFLVGAGDLPSTVATIKPSTQELLDANGVSVPLPPGADFKFVGQDAILRIGGWKIIAPVQVAPVLGAPRLVILAAGAVDVQASIFASAVGIVSGPGGGVSAAGTGAGGSPITALVGAGGAGFGENGAAGGGVTAKMTFGGSGGTAYGPLATAWNGGSGGGAPVGNTCIAFSLMGGGGGGAIQISSNVSIAVSSTASISANGGGGLAGCSSFGGGGGGSGGEIFLEAPTVIVRGRLFANGGGGGGATHGQDGQDSIQQATGGTASPATGAGGLGGAIGFPPTAAPDVVTTMKAGGGGGGVGRIWLRTRGTAADVSQATTSPAASIDTGL